MPDYDGSPTIGPGRGTLFVHGGNLQADCWKSFVALAGGRGTSLVVIPTALPDHKLRRFLSSFRGRANYALLHTNDRNEANSENFAAALRHASAVWMMGGRQWRLAKYYLGTLVEREIKALLARGGTVGGSSAGASIQASYLVRGKPGDEHNPNGDNTQVMAPEYEKGFALLPNSAIDQHVIAAKRQNDLQKVLEVYPGILGIGIDEATAIVVKGDVFVVVGMSRVIIHDRQKPPYYMSPGQSFDLRTRTVHATPPGNTLRLNRWTEGRF